MRIRALYCAGAVALATAGLAGGSDSASAARLRTVLRAVLLPEEAQHYEDMARQHRRTEEERYWRDYRGGLEERRRERGIGPEEASRYEEMAHRNRRIQEERYWRDYRMGPGPRR